jgi:uncharacterized protein (TIGR02246 family)
MYNRILMMAFLLMTSLGCTAQQVTPSPAEATVQRLFEGLNNADLEAVLSLFDEDVLFWGTSTTEVGTGIDSASAYWAALEGQSPGGNVASPLDIAVVELDENTQLLSGTWKVDIAGQDTAPVFRISLVVEQQNGAWKIVQFHNSRMP